MCGIGMMWEHLVTLYFYISQDELPGAVEEEEDEEDGDEEEEDEEDDDEVDDEMERHGGGRPAKRPRSDFVIEEAGKVTCELISISCGLCSCCCVCTCSKIVTGPCDTSDI